MQIVKTPAKILTQKAKPVKRFDKKLAKLVQEMIETLKAARHPEGIGLAAPQVGVLKRLFVIQVNANKPDEKPLYQAFINPEIIEMGSETPKNSYLASRSTSSPARGESTGQEWEVGSKIPATSHFAPRNTLEGCLSIENVWGFPQRSSWVKLKYQDLSGKKLTQKLSGFPAVIVQHEVDHLDGILFTHRVLEQRGKLYRIEKDEETKEPSLVPLDL